MRRDIFGYAGPGIGDTDFHHPVGCGCRRYRQLAPVEPFHGLYCITEQIHQDLMDLDSVNNYAVHIRLEVNVTRTPRSLTPMKASSTASLTIFEMLSSEQSVFPRDMKYSRRRTICPARCVCSEARANASWSVLAKSSALSSNNLFIPLRVI